MKFKWFVLVVVCAFFAIGSSWRRLSPASLQNGIPQSLEGFNPLAYDAMAMFANYHRGYTLLSGDTALRIIAHERSDPTSEWIGTESLQTTAYVISDAAFHTGGQVMFIGGELEDGTDVLEKWTFPLVQGAWAAVGPMSTAPLSAHVSGGTWSLPIHRSRNALVPDRTVVWPGHDFGTIRALACDPEARFLLLLSHDDSRLLRLDLGAPGSSPRVVLTLQQCPELASIGSMEAKHHDSEGRLYVLSSLRAGRSISGSVDWVVLKDADNDGDFDSHEVLATSEYLDRYPSNHWITLIGDGSAVVDFPRSK